jgi:hypothetical protein
MQWVLHHLPKVSDLQIEVRRNGKPLMETLSLDGDWKKSDISWRASMWGLPPRLGIGARQLTVAEKQERGLGPNALALRILWRPRGDVWEAGLRKGDIIVAADGKTEAMNHPRFNVWVKLNYRPGDQLPLKVIRGDQSVSLTILLK